MLRIIAHRQIKRRLVGVGDRDCPRGRCSVVVLPTRHQPLRRVECRGIDVGEQLRPLASEAPQHRIGHAGIARRPAVGLHQAHRKIHGRVVCDVQPEDLRGADKQCGFKSWRPRGELYPSTEEMAQGAKPAQHRSHQGAHQCAIAKRKGCKIGLRGAFFEFVVERPVPAQHTFEDLSSDPPRGKPGHINGESGTWHALICHEAAAPASRRFQPQGPRLSRLAEFPRGLPHAGDRREHSLAPWRPSCGTAGLDLYAMDRASNGRLKMRVRCFQAGARFVKECIGSSPRSWPDRRCVCRRRRRRSPRCPRNDRVQRRKSRRGRAPLRSAIVGRRYSQCSS